MYIDNVGYVNNFKAVNMPWIQYFPMDNQNIEFLYGSSNGIKASDISIVISKFGYDFLVSITTKRTYISLT